MDKYHVVFNADENYIKYAAVGIYSIIKALRERERERDEAKLKNSLNLRQNLSSNQIENSNSNLKQNSSLNLVWICANFRGDIFAIKSHC